ncbi:hypothetical protein FF1_028608 [Malus domestica]
MLLQLFFTVAFSAVPLTLYVPPIRSLNPLVETMEELFSESRAYTNRVYPRVRHLWFRILDCLLCSRTTRTFEVQSSGSMILAAQAISRLLLELDGQECHMS